jgi:hypothetical protein
MVIIGKSLVKGKKGGECQICEKVVTGVLLKRSVVLVRKNPLRMVVWCCQKCAAKLHFDTIPDVKLYVEEKKELPEGTVFKFTIG